MIGGDLVLDLHVAYPQRAIVFSPTQFVLCGQVVVVQTSEVSAVAAEYGDGQVFLGPDDIAEDGVGGLSRSVYTQFACLEYQPFMSENAQSDLGYGHVRAQHYHGRVRHNALVESVIGTDYL